MNETTIFREIVKERFCGQIISSDIVPASESDISSARAQYQETQSCNHEFVVDEKGWLYDYRKGAVCGKGMGAI